MFTRIQSRALCGAEPGARTHRELAGRSECDSGRYGKSGYKIQLSYHVKAIKRDSSGQYTMSGTVNGERQGRATLVFGFDEGSSGQAGKAPVHSYWVVDSRCRLQTRSKQN